MRKLNMKNRIKKQWKQPHFIVLVRVRKQEMVLVVCKLIDNSDGPDNSSFSGCGIQNPLGDCHDDGAS
jgi:hypothetical protein